MVKVNYNPPRTSEEREAEFKRVIDLYKDEAAKWEARYYKEGRAHDEARTILKRQRSQLERMESRYLPVNDLLIRKRVALGLTQKEVGALLGVSTTTISKWERKSGLQLETVVAYAMALLDFEKTLQEETKE